MSIVHRPRRRAPAPPTPLTSHPDGTAESTSPLRPLTSHPDGTASHHHHLVSQRSIPRCCQRTNPRTRSWNLQHQPKPARARRSRERHLHHHRDHIPQSKIQTNHHPRRKNTTRSAKPRTSGDASLTGPYPDGPSFLGSTGTTHMVPLLRVHSALECRGSRHTAGCPCVGLSNQARS
jgi:hypothetical protein